MAVVDKYIIDVRTQGAKKSSKELGGVDKSSKKMIGSITGMVAGLATAQLAFSQFSDAVRLAGEFEGVSAGFESLTAKAGFSANTLDKLTDALDGTANKIDIMKQANSAMLLGIFDSEEQMASMFDTAQRLGSALGLETTQAIESLTTGLGRQSKLMLDNLGIVFDTEKAYVEYAEALGLTASELTDAQKKQAFTNKAIAEAERLVSGLGDESLTMKDSFAQLSASMDNFKIAFANAFSEDIISFIGTVTEKMNDLAKANEKPVDSMVRTGDLLSSQKERYLELEKGIESFQNMVDNPYGDKFYDTIGRLAKKEGVGFEEMLTIMETSLVTMETEMAGLFETAKKFREEQAKGTETTAGQKEAVEGLLMTVENSGSAWDVYLQTQMESNNLALQTEEFNKKLIEQYPELAKAMGIVQKSTKDLKKEEQLYYASSLSGLRSMIKSKIQAYSAEMFAGLLSKEISSKGIIGIGTASLGAILAGQLFESVVPQFAQGGLIGGRRHSQGGTVIEAEQGEFVMSRNAVNSIGVENLNRMNDGSSGGSGATIIINNPIVNSDFVENEFSELMREAVRKGADFGIS